MREIERIICGNGNAYIVSEGENAMLAKRPLLIDDHCVLVGFNADKWDSVTRNIAVIGE